MPNTIEETFTNELSIFRLLFLPAEELAKLPIDIARMIGCLKKCMSDCDCHGAGEFTDAIGASIANILDWIDQAIRDGDKAAEDAYRKVLEKLRQAHAAITEAGQQAVNAAQDAKDAMEEIGGAVGESFHEFVDAVKDVLPDPTKPPKWP